MNKSLNNGGIVFNSKEKLQIFLKNRINALNDNDEYNLMAHEIKYSTVSNEKNRLENLETIKSYIFKQGFDVNGYPTVYGTMALMGSSKQEDVASNIVDYNYYNYQKDKIICLIAIPKYIYIGGKAVEFSSYNGTSAKSPDKELAMQYKKNGLTPDFHNYKCCLLDAIKGSSYLPRCYTLGAIKIDYKRGEYIYYESGTHLSYQEKEFKFQHDKAIEKKAISLFEKHNTYDIKEVIVGEYKKDLAWLNEQLDFDI